MDCIFSFNNNRIEFSYADNTKILYGVECKRCGANKLSSDEMIDTIKDNEKNDFSCMLSDCLKINGLAKTELTKIELNKGVWYKP